MSCREVKNSTEDFICAQCTEHLLLDDVKVHACLKDHLETGNIYVEGRLIFLAENAEPSQPTDFFGIVPPNELEEDEEEIAGTVAEGLWPDRAVKCLLDLYVKCKVLFDKRKILSKKQMYATIAEKMCKFGHNFSTQQVENKIKALEKTYKKKIDNKGPKKTGRSRLQIDYEKELDDIFGKVHSIKPRGLISTNINQIIDEENRSSCDNQGEQLVTSDHGSEEQSFNNKASSEGTLENSSSPSFVDDKENVPENSSSSVNLKKKAQQYSDSRMCKRTIRESDKEARERRHKENLAKKEEYLRLKRRESKLKEAKLKYKLKDFSYSSGENTDLSRIRTEAVSKSHKQFWLFL